jgi:hypothetical protein
MTKPGRNDPCPCGSGKKYKHCHGSGASNVIPFPGALGADEAEYALGAGEAERLASALASIQEGPSTSDGRTFMDRMGRPNAATAVIHDLQAAIGDRVFESKGELESFMESFVARQREGPIDDFLGLSPAQMRAILHGGPEGLAGIVRLEARTVRAEDLPSAPLLEATLALLGYLAEDGPVKATAKGNLPRALVLRWWDEIFGPREKNERIRAIMRPRNEEDAGGLHDARRIAQKAGLIKMRGGEFSVTELGRRLHDRMALGELYLALFRTVGWDFDWNDGRDDFRTLHPLSQESFVFNLHLLGKLARAWTFREPLVEAYLRAFPAVRADFVGGGGRDLETYRSVTLGIGLTHYPIELGLLEVRGGWENGSASPEEYRVSPLFDRFLVWDASGRGAG